MYKLTAWNYFYKKWKDTWKHGDPVHTSDKQGWIKNWSDTLIEDPPDIKKSKIKTSIRYIYFEKDLNLPELNYLAYDRPQGR